MWNAIQHWQHHKDTHLNKHQSCCLIGLLSRWSGVRPPKTYTSKTRILKLSEMPNNPDGDAYKRSRLVRAAKAAAAKAKVAEERAAEAEKKVAEAEEKADKAGSRVAKLILNHTSHAKQKDRLDKESIARPTRP